MGRGASALLAAGLLLLLLPGEAWAWGPGVHVYLGLEVLGSLNLFPARVASLLAAYPLEFLYGSLAADISMAKRYAPVGRHCHHWHVGWEIYGAAGEDPALRAAAQGYLAHLAADVVAHNAFVPRMLLLTSSTRALGHSYWEHRMDARLGAQHLSLARRVVTQFDHSRADALFDGVLSRTLFSFRVNRRIFRGLIRVSDLRRWQSLFDTVVDNSRWELLPAECERYLRDTFELVADLLVCREASRAVQGDPIGSEALRRAKALRRTMLRREGLGASPLLAAAAERHFPLPDGPAHRWEARGGTPEVVADLSASPPPPDRRGPQVQQVAEGLHC